MAIWFLFGWIFFWVFVFGLGFCLVGLVWFLLWFSFVWLFGSLALVFLVFLTRQFPQSISRNTSLLHPFLRSLIFVFYPQQTFWKVRHILVILSGLKHCHCLARWLSPFSSHKSFIKNFKNSTQSIPPQPPLWYEMAMGLEVRCSLIGAIGRTIPHISLFIDIKMVLNFHRFSIFPTDK